jgi:hypothetical protein
MHGGARTGARTEAGLAISATTRHGAVTRGYLSSINADVAETRRILMLCRAGALPADWPGLSALLQPATAPSEVPCKPEAAGSTPYTVRSIGPPKEGSDGGG